MGQEREHRRRTWRGDVRFAADDQSLLLHRSLWWRHSGGLAWRCGRRGGTIVCGMKGRAVTDESRLDDHAARVAGRRGQCLCTPPTSSSPSLAPSFSLTTAFARRCADARGAASNHRAPTSMSRAETAAVIEALGFAGGPFGEAGHDGWPSWPRSQKTIGSAPDSPVPGSAGTRPLTATEGLVEEVGGSSRRRWQR